MNKLKFDCPCVLRLIPGMNNDNPIIVLFDDPEDALAYWHENMYEDELDGTGDGYNHLHIDDEIEISYFDYVDIKHVSHEDLLKFIKRGEEYWMRKVCNRYPTDEEKYERWYSIMDDDPEEQLALWCLNNNIQHNDYEAKKYAAYRKDEYVYYGHNECHADDEEYLAFVEETLKLPNRHSHADFVYTHFN